MATGNFSALLAVFEDIARLDDPSLVLLLRLSDPRDVALALRAVEDNDLAERGFTLMEPSWVREVRQHDNDQAPPDDETAFQAKQQLQNILRGLFILGKVRYR